MKANLIKSQMALHGDTQADLAEAMGISTQSLSKRMHGKKDFSRQEIEVIAKRYSLSCEQICNIFFNLKVD